MYSSLKSSLLLAVFAASAFGQSETGKATLEGRVLDPSGNAVSAVEVSALATQTGIRRKITTDNEGKFRLSSMAVGVYDVDAVASGFALSRVTGLELLVGQTRTLTISLSVASVSTQMKVETGAEIVNQADTNNSTVIGQRAIEDLPIRGRNFADFIQLTPNVMQEANRNGLVVNGQRSINSNISVDGVDFNDSLQGGQRGGGANESVYFFPQLAVREFQVVRDGASAEVGRTNSGYVNVVTKSGTNTFHGQGFYANRNGSLTSPDAFGNDSSSNSQHQFGGALGGPIRKEKLFFFGAVEKNLVTIPYTVKFNKPTGNVVIPADILNLQGSFDQKNNPLVAFGKLDYQLNQANSLNVQYTYAAQNGLNFGGASGQTSTSATNNTILDRASQGIKAAWTTVLSPTLLNEVRGQYAYDNRRQVPNSLLAEVDINDFGTLGGSKTGTYIYEATRYEVLDNLSWSRGIHSIKVGADLNFNPQRQQRETNYGGVYTFATLADYLAALGGNNSRIQQYQQTIAANGKQGLYVQQQKDFAAFFNDSIRLRPDLTISVGLRWDGQVEPQPPANPAHPINGQIPNDLKMWQPRLGLAWNVGAKGKTVIRASAGPFDARTPGYLLQRVFTDNGVNTLVLDSSVDPTLLTLLKVPDVLTLPPGGLKTPISNAIYAFDPNFRNPRSGQSAIALEQQITSHTKVVIGYTHNATWNLQRRFDTNLFAPTTLANGNPVYPAFDSVGKLVAASGFNPVTFAPLFIDSATGKTLTGKVARPDPTVGQINVNKSVAHSSYDGTAISLQHQLSRRMQFGLNYTYSFNQDDDSNERDFNRQPALNTFDLTRDAAYAKNDIRHSGNMNVVYDVGRGFTLSTIVFARTGVPVKPVTGSDLQNDGNTVNDRPIVNGYILNRDAIRQPGFFDWDLRLLKTFHIGEKMRLDISAEGFNLTRSSNKSFNGDGETSFGKPQAAVNPLTGYAYTGNTAGVPTFSPGTDRFGGPRQGQLGMRFQF